MAETIAGAAAVRPQAAATGREQGPTPGRQLRRRISILPAEKWRTGCRCFCSLLLCFPLLNFSKFFFSLVLDTFFFRLRGKGRGTHLRDPTQHRSNSGAGARISSKFFFSFFFRFIDLGHLFGLSLRHISFSLIPNLVDPNSCQF